MLLIRYVNIMMQQKQFKFFSLQNHMNVTPTIMCVSTDVIHRFNPFIRQKVGVFPLDQSEPWALHAVSKTTQPTTNHDELSQRRLNFLFSTRGRPWISVMHLSPKGIYAELES